MLPVYLDTPYRLQLGGQFLSDGHWSHMDRTIDDYELIIGLSGVVFLEAEGLMYEVKEGDTLLLMPGGAASRLQAVSSRRLVLLVPFSDAGRSGGASRMGGFRVMRHARRRTG